MSDPADPQRRLGPIDSDVDLSVPTQRAELHGHHPAVIGAIAIGGAVGSLARYQLGRWWPTPTNGFPSTTLVINVVGCLLIGVLMALIAAARSPHPLIRPFFGTGMLGGFTTFSTYAVDLQTLLAHGKVGTALGYLAGTAIGAIAAAAIGMTLTRRLIRPTPMRSPV